MKLKLTDIGALIAERQLEGRENAKSAALSSESESPFMTRITRVHGTAPIALRLVAPNGSFTGPELTQCRP